VPDTVGTRPGKRSSPSIVAALARAHIEEGFRGRISLSSLARELRISREHLCRSFKASYQVTVTDYIRAKRIQEALLLVEAPDVQLKEVGHAVGYTTYNEFFRAFKRVVQMTPTAYLNRIRARRTRDA
jgi:two-component system response regulator YesN